MNKIFAIQSLQMLNPSLSKDKLVVHQIKRPNKVGPFNKNSILDLYIDEKQKNIIMYYDNVFYCSVQNYVPNQLNLFLETGKIPSPEECKKFLTQCI